MRSALTCLPLALLFIAIVPSNAQTNAPTTAEPVNTPVPEITTNISPVTTSGPEIIPVVSPVEGSASEPGAVQYYDIPRNMSFYCNIAKTDGEIYDWNKNNISISQVTELKDRYKLEDSNAILVIQHTSEDDAGNYTCKLANLSQHCVSEDDAGNHTCKLANVSRHCVSEDGAGNHTCKLANVSRHCVSEGDAGNHTCKLANVSRHWALKARPYTMLPSTELRAIEGQELKLVCKVFGKPVVPVDWFFNKDAASYNETTNRGVQLKNSTHIKLETNQAGVPNGQLVIEAPVLEDAGAYACLPVVEENLQRSPHANAVIVVHVKEMYAAMWPFLGICAEVLVLCAIILVYEKRRTKPELEDSDTDNHDEKKL